MAGKKKQGTVGKITEAVKDAASSVAQAAQDHVIQPVGEALGLAGEKKQDEKNIAERATKRAAARKSAARMMTRSMGGKAPTGKKGKSKPGGSMARPTQKPSAGAGRKAPRRGASKGR